MILAKFSEVNTMGQIYTIDEVNKMIDEGKKLVLSGDEKVLERLNTGFWIAGTTPYFFGQNGGELNQEMIFVEQLPEYVADVSIKTYDENTIKNIYTEAPDHGFVLVIMTGFSKTLDFFSMNAPEFPDFATRPLFGWVSGSILEDIGKVPAKIYDGRKKKSMEEGAISFHVSLPPNKIASLDFVNIFEQGDGDELTFPEDGYSFKEIFVNGEKKNFAEYLMENKVDFKCPLVADYYGAKINTSLKELHEEEKIVDLWCPVFKGVSYKLSAPVPDYAAAFIENVPNGLGDQVVFSCNCLLNYLYGELEGKRTADIRGPITFGEIAYQLLNQTLAYLTITDRE